MENNNWEKEFSKLAMDAEVTPPDHIWTNIENSMDKAKKGRRMFPGIFLGGVILVMFVFAFAFRDKIFSNLESHAEHTNKTNLQEELADHNLGKASENNTSGEEKSGQEAISEIPSSSQVSDYFSINNNANYDESYRNLPILSGDKATIESIAEEKEMPAIEMPITENANENTYRIEGSQKVETTYLNSNRSTRTSKFAGNISTLTASSLASENMMNLKSKVYQAIYENNSVLDVSPFECASFKLPQRPIFYTDIEAAVGYSSKLLSPKTIGATEYMGRRNQSEKIWYNSGGAIHLGSLWSNISLDIGLEYFQINEVFTGNKENETRITINIIEDGMGNVIGRDTVAEVGVKQLISRNTYRQYVLPVRFGYFQSIEKLTMGVNFGAAYAFRTEMEGVIFDNDGTYYDINRDEKNYFNKDGYWKIITGIYLGYRTGTNMEIYIRPQISLDQRSMDRIASPVSQSFNNIQFFGGVRYFFP